MESRSAMPLHGRGRNKTRLARARCYRYEGGRLVPIEQGSLNGTHFANQLCKTMYGNFEGFPENNKALFGLVIQ